MSARAIDAPGQNVDAVITGKNPFQNAVALHVYSKFHTYN